MTPKTNLLTTGQVAEVLNVHPATVRRWADEGSLPAIKLPGGGLRFRRLDVDAILQPTERKAS